MNFNKLALITFLCMLSIPFSQDGWEHKWWMPPKFNGVSASSDSIAWYVGDNSMAIRITPSGFSRHCVVCDPWMDLTTVFTPRGGQGETCFIGTGEGHVLKFSYDGFNVDHVYTYEGDGGGFINGIYFWDENEGIALGDPPLYDDPSQFLILKTYDGGDTWDEITNGIPNVPLSWGIKGLWDSVEDHIWYPVFSSDSTINTMFLYSSDRGENWETLAVPEDYWFSNRINFTFTNEQNGIISNGYGLTTTTTDGGETWDEPQQNDEYLIRGIKCAKGTETIFAHNNNEIIRSDDFGETWYSQGTPSNAYISYFDVLDENIVWAAGFNQLILKTTNGGGTGLSIVQGPSNPMVPTGITLEQNYPNPFNPDTKIKFKLEQSGPVRLSIFNVMGQEVRKLIVNRNLDSGYYTEIWDGKDNHGVYVPTGNYFYRIEQNGATQSKKMVMLK